MKFREFIQEQKEKHAVLAFGRMNPPTTGHAKLVDKVKDVAKSVGGSHHVVLSHSQDPKKNPLSAKDKLKHAKRFFPDTNLSTSNKEHPTFLDQASKLHKSGVTHLHMVAGSDRTEEYKKKLAQYNGKHEGALFNFKKITVHSSGERDPDAEGTEGMSASKMRSHASTGKFNEFKKGIPSHVQPHHAKELYNDVRKHMGLKESIAEDARVPKKPGQPDKSDKHSDLYTDEDPKGTIHGLKFATPEDAKASVSKIKSSGRSHAHKIQAAIAMEQRAKVMGKASAAAIYRSFINSMKDKTEKMNEDFEEMLIEGVHDKGIFKAIFLAGGPGSGKDYVLDNTLSGHGLTEINSDKALEFLMDKKGLNKTMPASEKIERDVERGKAKNMTELRQRLALQGRNGLIINGTGDDHEKIKVIKSRLEELGYDTSMVLVNTRDEVSASRNVERGTRGGRTVPENIRKQKWDAVQNSRPELAKLFGDKYVEFENSDDLRVARPEVVQAKKEELLNLYKGIQKFMKAPPKSEQASGWVANELKKKDTMVVDKKTDSTPHPNTAASNEARKLGLEYYGFGRYGKDRKTLYRSVHDKLVKVSDEEPQQPNIPISGSSMKPQNKVNEEFEELFERCWDGYTARGMKKKGNRMVPNCVPVSEAKRPTALERFRAAADERERKHDAIEAKRKADAAQGKENLSGAIDRLNNQLNKEEVKLNDKHLLKDDGGKVRKYMLRRAAAKEAHINGGVVHKMGNGYVIKIKENENVTSTNEFFQEQTKRSGGTSSDGSGESCGNSKAKITLSQIRSKKEKVSESIDRGIEPGLSMAQSGENFSRPAGEKLTKKGRVVTELTGDETTASIGDQKEDELKKKGISLLSFKKRNYAL